MLRRGSTYLGQGSNSTEPGSVYPEYAAHRRSEYADLYKALSKCEDRIPPG